MFNVPFNMSLSQIVKEYNEYIHTSSCVYGNNVYKDMLLLFGDVIHDINFLQNLDSNKNLIGFENGLYDLNIGHFRNGLQSDYVSLSTKYAHIAYNVILRSYNTLINKFLMKLQPDFEMREYLLTLLSLFLGPKQDIIPLLIGCNSTCKHILVKLIKLTFGQYCNVRPHSFISKGHEKKIPCNTGIRLYVVTNIKHELPYDFINEATYNLMFMCKKMPKIDVVDIAKCIKIIPFVDIFNKEDNGQYNIFDCLYKLECKQVFMLNLLDYYKKYLKNGLIVPQAILEYTNNALNNKKIEI